jgi:hypothetical protein
VLEVEVMLDAANVAVEQRNDSIISYVKRRSALVNV